MAKIPEKHKQFELPQVSENKKIIIGVTGSVATIKLIPLIQQLLELDVSVVVIATNNALNFFNQDEVPSHVPVFSDKDEWENWKSVQDPILHIELRRWADLMVIAPLDANTLAKIANGLCDNLLTCVVRAWDISRPLLFCPAMNTHMWSHPITARHLTTLQEYGYIEIPPVTKKLACGDEGMGAMAQVPSIVEVVKKELKIKDGLNT